ncbi:MAG: hypothetical protein ACK5MZ_11550 [Aestuariibaculum sp.]
MNNKRKKYYKDFFKFVLYLGLVVITVSCFSVKPGSTKTAKHLYEEFFVGEEGTQYFIKPLAFKGEDNNEYLEMDFTFRYKKVLKDTDSASINISLITQNITKTVDSLLIGNGKTTIKIKNLDFLFTDRKKDLFLGRFNSKISLVDLDTLFKNSEWNLTLYNSNTSILKFSSESSTKKNVEKINYELFGTF